MKQYIRPMLLDNDELTEGVYAASGDVGGDSGTHSIKCDSIYMQSEWQAPDYSADGTAGYKKQFGCLGCPAFTYSGCGLLTHYVASGGASSYDEDNGKRMPSWEALGYGPGDKVTDWNLTGEN